MGSLIIEMVSARASQWLTNPNSTPVGSYEICDRKAPNRPRAIIAAQTCSDKNGRSGIDGHGEAWVCFGGAVARAWRCGGGGAKSRNWFGYNDISDPLLCALPTPNSGAMWDFRTLVAPMGEGGPIYPYVSDRRPFAPRRTKSCGS